jgi:SAM-dependent methyltransferase
MNREAHWDTVYRTKQSHEVSWFQQEPAQSLRLMAASGLSATSCVIDVGGGDSRLVDRLVDLGLTCVTVLDVSAAAIERARARLGSKGEHVRWLEADVTGEWSVPPVDIWHDRAVFHFLIDPVDRHRYLAHLRATLKPGGSAIIATFSLDGPERCSGLPVRRYSPESLAAELGADFRLVESASELHSTPTGSTQSFQYSRFVYPTA